MPAARSRGRHELAAERSARRVTPAATLALGLRGGRLKEGHEQVELGEHPGCLDGDVALQISLTGSFLDQKLQGPELPVRRGAAGLAVYGEMSGSAASPICNWQVRRLIAASSRVMSTK